MLGTMEWLRNNTFMGLNRLQPRQILSNEEDCDPTACYDSFKEHWQQAYKIILRTQQLPSHDDVLGVVNHLEQMVTLLLYDVKKVDQITLPLTSSSHCLQYLISENVLDKLFEWGIRTGKYTNAVRLEQIKFYKTLVTHSRHLLLVHEPFLKPLVKLLLSCQGEMFTEDMEKNLIELLYQLCVLLMQNVDLLDLFFTKAQNGCTKFIIFALLMPYIHRENARGMQARDALLLLMSLSKKNKTLGVYITDHSNICMILASGLSGLYFELPQVLTDVTSPDWHRLTPDDVNDIKKLSTFVTSLEFTNAVAQVSHPLVRRHLQEFLYRGFLVPVLGPALLQTGPEECVTATAYLELILRTVTHPGLFYALLQFLLQMQYDGDRILHILTQRIHSEDQLSLVTLALFETIVDLNCEDLMLELVYQHLQPCLHLMLSQRRKLLPLDPHCHSFEKLLLLAPSCCETSPASPQTEGRSIHWNHYNGHQSVYGNYHAYLCDARNKIALCQSACSNWSHSYTGCDSTLPPDTQMSEEYANSLPSLGESSGYESLKIKTDEPVIEDTATNSTPVWQISHANLVNVTTNTNVNGHCSDKEQLTNTGTAGLFLTNVLEKLKNMLSNTLYLNLHLTGLISRLAVYSHPLLRTYLLDSGLVLQPNVPSLIQIIGSLKQQIDDYMGRQPDSAMLIRQARAFLLERESRLLNARRNTLERTPLATESTDQPFQRNSSKRKSFSSSLPSFSSMFGKRPSQAEASFHLSPPQEVQNFVHPKLNEAQHVALCAVLLDEWVKELAALAQEHTIAQLATLFK